MYKIFFYIYFILSINLLRSQVFTETSFRLDSNKLGVGIESNNYISAIYKFTNFFKLNAVNSAYIEKLQYQRYIINGYFKIYKYKVFNINCAIKVFGNYNNGIINKGISPQFNFITNKLSLSAECNSMFYESLKFYPKISVGINFKDKMFFIEHGPPFYRYDNEIVTNYGILFVEKKIVLKTFIQIPKFNDYKHTRLEISFAYMMKY